MTGTLPGLKLFSQAEGKGGKLLEGETCSGIAKLVWTGEVTGTLGGSSGEGPETGRLLSAFKLSYAQKSGVQKYHALSKAKKQD